ncbi:hypothetical protein [Thermoplasma acidophilum]|uniref:hypothetical protein n=1 Tax=Thermoplasma acidophilum TaxID=2303 RepID=UPI00064ECF43|nr:hypothetical protein [Thermoplasma acidophilum]
MSEDSEKINEEIRIINSHLLEFQDHVLERIWGIFYINIGVLILFFSFSSSLASSLFPSVPAAMFVFSVLDFFMAIVSILLWRKIYVKTTRTLEIAPENLRLRIRFMGARAVVVLLILDAAVQIISFPYRYSTSFMLISSTFNFLAVAYADVAMFANSRRSMIRTRRLPVAPFSAFMALLLVSYISDFRILPAWFYYVGIILLAVTVALWLFTGAYFIISAAGETVISGD